MTTATIQANNSVCASMPASRAATTNKRRVGLTGVIAALGEALAATRQYHELADKGAPPAEAARKALLGK